jgi:methylated-DNA-protein-cysteine methyltransferase-like protein
MNACHNHQSNIPAHRVVNHSGLLTGKRHFDAPNVMQMLLEKEGVKVKNNKVVNFKAVFWDPTQELINDL